MRAGVACLIVLASATRAAAQAQDPSLDYLLDYSSVPMQRNASLVDLGARAIERGMDWGLGELTGDFMTRRSTGGVVARAARWSMFDFILAGFASVVTHEYGHKTRAEELGRDGSVHIRLFGPSFFSARGPLFTPRENLAVFAGGIEGARVLGDHVEDRIHARGVASAGDLTTVLVTTFASVGYVLGTLSEDRLSSPERFLDGRRSLPGDPAQYSANLTGARLSLPRVSRADVTAIFPEIQSASREIRRGTLLNLLDYGLAGAATGVFRDHIWRGEERVQVRWLRLGPVSIVPALRYELSPTGPERQVRVRFKAGAGSGLALMRWSDRLTESERGVFGLGGYYQHVSSAGIEPKLSLDVWRNPTGESRARVEASMIFRRASLGRLLISAGAGAKGAGYVAGYPLDAGGYFNAGAGLRF